MFHLDGSPASTPAALPPATTPAPAPRPASGADQLCTADRAAGVAETHRVGGGSARPVSASKGKKTAGRDHLLLLAQRAGQCGFSSSRGAHVRKCGRKLALLRPGGPAPTSCRRALLYRPQRHEQGRLPRAHLALEGAQARALHAHHHSDQCRWAAIQPTVAQVYHRVAMRESSRGGRTRKRIRGVEDSAGRWAARLTRLGALVLAALWVSVTGLTPSAADAAAGVDVTNLNEGTVPQYAVGVDGALAPLSPPTVPAGTHPVHIAISPDGKSPRRQSRE